MPDIVIDNAQYIRAQLYGISGRADLVTSDGDNVTDYQLGGIDFYINAGLRYLDDQLPTGVGISRYFEEISAGQYHTNSLLNVRYISGVWLYDPTEDARSELTFKTYSWMRKNYTQDWDNETQGTPLYWTPNLISLAPQQKTSVAGDFTYSTELDTITAGDSGYAQSGVIFLPAADGAYELSIVGAFYSQRFDDPSVRNFWTINYPDAVVYATMLKLEHAYRNKQGATDWIVAIDDVIRGIDYNAVEQEMSQVRKVDNTRADLSRVPASRSNL